MVFFNYALRKLNAKIVYYGPGLCGKTTNLQWIHDHFEGGQRGKMISLSTEGDRTIFFDLLPLDIGSIRGMDVTLQLYTVPGQVHYNSTRQLVLRGADGVVFVADSQATMRTSNVDSLRNLKENLSLQGVEIDGFPHVLQFNKRDLGDLISIEDLDSDLNQHSVPFFEATAVEGVGVQETLEGIVKLVMRSLRERYEPVPPVGPKPPDGEPTLLDVEVPPAAPFVAFPPPAPEPPAVEPPVTLRGPTAPGGIQDDVPTRVYESGHPPEEEEGDDALPGAAFWDAAEEASGPTFGEGGADFPGDEPTGSKNFGFAMPFADNETTTDVKDLGDQADGITADRLSDALTDEEIASEEMTPIDVTESPFEVADLTPEPFSAGSVFGDPQGDGESQGAVADGWTDGWAEDDGVEIAEDEFGDDSPVIAEAGEGPDVSEEPAMAAGTVDDLVASVLGNTLNEPADSDAAEFGDETEPHLETDDDDTDGAGLEIGAPIDDVEGDAAEAAFDEAGDFVESTDGDLSAEDAQTIESDDDDELPEDVPTEVLDQDGEGEAWQVEPEDGSESFEDAPYPTAGDEELSEPAAAGSQADDFSLHEPELEFEPPPVAEEELDFAPVEDFEPSESGEETEAAVGGWDEAHTDEFLLEASPEAAVDEDVEAGFEDQALVEEKIEAEPDLDVSEEVAEEENVLEEDGEPIPEHRPIIFGEGDPFGDETDDMATPVRSAVEPHVEISAPVDDGNALVRAGDNQLHLRLQGTGAIAESGQVRALDIEVPVPGSWVGNRRVTLQLRLTLSPMPEDDDGRPGDAS